MRIGAIFARGSCRALKWTALLGVMFVLGAGGTAAQTVTKVEVSNSAPAEGGGTLTVTATVAIPATVTARGTANVTLAFQTGTSFDHDNNSGTTAVSTGIKEGEGAETTGNYADVTLLNTNPLPVDYEAGTSARTVKAEFTLSIGADLDAEVDAFLPTARIGDASWVYPSEPVKITEAQQQTYELEYWLDMTVDKQVESVTEGLPDGDDDVNAIQIRLVPKPARTADLTYHVGIQGISPVVYTLSQGSADPAGAQVGGRADGGTVGTHDYATLSLVANDGNRTDDTATVTIYGGSVLDREHFATAELTLNDIHKLPKVIAQWTNSSGAKLSPQPNSAKEGDALYLTLTVDRANAAGDAIASTLDSFDIALEPSGAATKVDYELGTIASVAAGTTDGTTPAIKLTLEEDVDVNDEMLVFDAKVTPVATTYGTGEEVSEGVLSILIEDTTALNITPKSDDDVDTAYKAARMAADEAGNGDGWWTAAGDPGDGPLTIQLADLFDLPKEGFLVTGDARSSDITVATTDADGTMVMVTPKSDGEATITVTAGVAASSAQISQNLATVEIKVVVDALPQKVTVTTSPTGSVDEGGTITVTAKLNQLAPADTAIDLNVQGPVEGDDHSVTIMADDMTGTVDLMVSDDDMVQAMTDIVIITGTEVEGVKVEPQVITLTVTEDDEPAFTISAKSQEDVDAVFMAATGGNLAVGDDDVMVDMSKLFETESTNVTYVGESSNVGSVTAGSSGNMLTLMVGEAGSSTITVKALDNDSGHSASASSVVDVNLQALVVRVSADSMTLAEGGDPATITASANRAVTADTSWSLTVTGDRDAVAVEPDTLTIPSGMKTGTATVTAVPDDGTADASVEVVVGGPALVVDGNPVSTVSLPFAITDDDRTVNAKSQAEVTAVFTTAVAGVSTEEGWLPGGKAATVDMSALFDIEDEATVQYEATSDADTVGASASGSTLTLTPAASGDATITVTATDTSGDADDHASVMADVSVGVLPLVVTLSGPARRGRRGRRQPRRGPLVRPDGDREPGGHGRHHGRDHARPGDERRGRRRHHGVGHHHRGRRDVGHDQADGRRRRPGRLGHRHARGARALRHGRQHADQLAVVQHLGRGGSGPAGDRAAPAGGLPGCRRLPPLPAATVAFGGGVRSFSPWPPLRRTPRRGGGSFLDAPDHVRPPPSRREPEAGEGGAAFSSGCGDRHGADCKGIQKQRLDHAP